uniref:Uncharacterized protein n=1 Tax=Anopheles epiroticus TaxID=199890 RepID=A0A182PG72_9DIPT
MLRQHPLVLVWLACLAANCCSSSSEYLIIRHGRSRVRHSSEKDHIRWGLQVFDNFTLLDYDAGGGSGSGVGSEEAPSSAKEQPSAVPGGAAAGSTLTIRFDESEELERMIELSDFDNLRLNGRTVPEPSTTGPPTTGRERKLIKKEIMENIRRTVDKGLQYLKAHNNLDEVKIELVPVRGRMPAGRPVPIDGAGSVASAPNNQADPPLPWEAVGVGAKSVQRSPNAQVSASNQRLISLDAVPRTLGTASPPERSSSDGGARYGWPPAPGSRVAPDGEDYPNDMPAAVDTQEEEEREANDGRPGDDGLLQDDDPLLQDEEQDGGDGGETEQQEADGLEGEDAADINNVFHMEDSDLSELDETSRNNRRNLMKGRDVVTQFLQIVESQHLLGANCTAGTALNLGDGVVDRYAQDRFRVEAEIAVNRANMLTR